jgi:hypothetical protein
VARKQLAGITQEWKNDIYESACFAHRRSDLAREKMAPIAAFDGFVARSAVLDGICYGPFYV